MDFVNRLKKELTEGIVRSLLVDAGYRVVDFGIERQLREIECMKASEYLKLGFPPSLRYMPDLVVLDKGQTVKFFVEVKFRNGWTTDVFHEIEEQVKNLEELVLVFVNGKPPEDKRKLDSPSLNVRCCRLRYTCGVYEIQLIDESWYPVKMLRTENNQWWGMNLLQNIFVQFHDCSDNRTIAKAVGAIRQILSTSC